MNLVLHAHWRPPTLLLWGERGGETGAPPQAAQPDEPGAPPQAAQPARGAWRDGAAHPRALPLEELRAVLGDLVADSLLASVAQEATLTMDVPGNAQGPAASAFVEMPNQMLRPDPKAPHVHAGFSGAWVRVRIVALAFAAGEAMDLLDALTPAMRQTPEAPQPPAGAVRCADSLKFWGLLARFAAELMARRQFLPQAQRRQPEGPFIASWRVVVSDQRELDWLERMAGALPPVCLAAAQSGEPVGMDAAQLVESFLAAGADAIVRRCVADDPFFRLAEQRAAAADAAPEMRWLAALLGKEPRIAGPEADNELLVQQVQAWTAPAEPAAAAVMWRLGFTLHEPAEESATPLWSLTLSLHSPESGEAPIPVADLQLHAGDSVLLGRHFKNQRGQLLAELSRAAQTYPALAVLLPRPHLGRLELSTAEAYAFMRHWGPLLAKEDFGVELPSWSETARSELGLRLRVHPADEPWPEPDALSGQAKVHSRSIAGDGGTHFGLESLLEFDWQIALGDQSLSIEEFEAAVHSASPLMRLQGRWVEIDTGLGTRMLEFLRQAKQGPKISLVDALRTAYGASRELAGLRVVGLEGQSWVRSLLEQAPAADIENIDQPPTFVGMLRPYQLRGLRWLVFLQRLGLGCCLADDMGLGKTIQFIALMLHDRLGGSKMPGPTLLFTPTSVVGNWLREIERFGPSLRVLVHHGPDRLAGSAFVEAAAAHDIVVTSYALAHRDFEDLLRIPWHCLALDEAQKIKNPSAASTLAIRSLEARYRVALTGTPIENHLSELWSIMQILNPGLLGPAAEFRERFAVPVEKLGDRGRADQLRKLIRPFVLRRLKSDPDIAGDLPEKMEMRVFCSLTPEQAALYERFVARSLDQIDAAAGIRRRGLILATLTRLKQICDHPALVLDSDDAAAQELDQRSGKCERLAEMLEEVLEEGDAALIFTQFRQMGHLLERLLKSRLGTEVLFLHGGSSAKQRTAMIDRFQERSDVRLFILSLRAGGLGLNLTAANHVFHFDRWWNPAVEAQATDRAHRVGQTRQVQVHKFVCLGTMEERIDRLLSEKLALADQIIGSGDEFLTGLSTEQLRQYLSLSPEAVENFEEPRRP